MKERQGGGGYHTQEAMTWRRELCRHQTRHTCTGVQRERELTAGLLIVLCVWVRVGVAVVLSPYATKGPDNELESHAVFGAVLRNAGATRDGDAEGGGGGGDAAAGWVGGLREDGSADG